MAALQMVHHLGQMLVVAEAAGGGLKGTPTPSDPAKVVVAGVLGTNPLAIQRQLKTHHKLITSWVAATSLSRHPLHGPTNFSLFSETTPLLT